MSGNDDRHTHIATLRQGHAFLHALSSSCCLEDRCHGRHKISQPELRHEGWAVRRHHTFLDLGITELLLEKD